MAIDQRVRAAIETLDHGPWTTTPNACLMLAKQGFADRPGADDLDLRDQPMGVRGGD